MNVDKGYQPTVKSSTGEDMGALGQVTFTFKINDGTRSFSKNTSRRPPYSTTRMHQTCYRWDEYQNEYRFHHRNPNVYIPYSFVNNPNNKYNPKYILLTIFNLSKVDHPGRDTVIAFTDVPEFETYNVEIASESKIKEHLAKPRNWLPQRHETLPEIPSDTAFICSPADAPGRSTCRIKTSPVMFTRGLKNYVMNMDRHSQNIMRTLAEQSLSKWM